MLGRLVRRLRRDPSDINVILPFDEVVSALGRRGERHRGLETIDLDSIVGTVDRAREFDRRFRPTSRRVRQRWERIAKAIRRGEAMPPIEVYRIGELHFVRDGHHRVSVARQLRLEVIEADVTEIITAVGAEAETRIRDLAMKGHERLFYERVPLPAAARSRMVFPDKWGYAELAECIEAWGFRAMQAQGEFLTREEVAAAWFKEEYLPAVELMRAADLVGRGTETEAYTRIITLRYMLLRSHDWSDATIERLREELRRGTGRDDTGVHRLIKDVGL
jgi:hypothetical protein